MESERFNKGIKEIRKSGLNNSEKSFVLGNISAYADKNVSKYSAKEISKPIKSPFWRHKTFSYVFRSRTQFAYVVLVLLVLTSGGGLVLASRNSLPGDLLYPLKVNVSEPLQGVATFGLASKINWEAEKVQNRLEEVETLAVKGKLNNKTMAVAENQLNIQTQSFFNAVANANKATSSAETVGITSNATVDLESKISAHDKILEKLQNHSNPSQKDEIAKFRLSVEGQISQASTTEATSTESNTQSNTTEPKATQMSAVQIESTKNASTTADAFTRKEKAIENLIQNTEDSLNQKDGNLSTSTLKGDILNDTKSNLEEAKSTLQSAKQKRDSGDEVGASKDLQNSRLQAENADIFLKQGIILGNQSGN
jgi:hypothetical protein